MHQLAVDLMNLLPSHRESLDAVARAASTALLSNLWQGAVIAGGLYLCLTLSPRLTAAHRFALWAAGFVSLIALPMLPAAAHWIATGIATLIGIQSSPNTSFSTLTFAANAQKSLLVIDQRWSFAIGALWLAASLYRAVDLAIHSIQLRKLWKTAEPLDLNSSFNFLLEVPGRKPVQLCATLELERPSVIGFLSPRILIPEWLLERLTPGELDQIVLHEVEHLRRRDDWTNLIQKLCLILFPLNPALLWIERRLCSEREMACDEGVVRITNAPRAYAACLTSLAERGLHHRIQAAGAGALSLGAWQRRPELARRVHSILLRKQFLGPLGARCLLAAMSSSLVLGLVFMARCPELVGFAPAPETAMAQAAAQSHTDLATEMPSRHTGAYMTNLKAVMPEPGNTASSKTALPRHQARIPASHVVPKPDALPPYAVMAQMAQAQPAVSDGHWLVMTTWEQLDSAPSAPQTDYAQAEQPQAGSQAGQPSTKQQSRVAVTRLVFRMLPVRALISDTPDSGPSNPSDPSDQSHPSHLSNPVNPATPMVTIRGGWIVFQL